MSEDELRRSIRVVLLNVLIRSHPDSGALAQEAADALLPVVLADARQRAAEVARRVLNTVDPLQSGVEVRRQCVELIRAGALSSEASS